MATAVKLDPGFVSPATAEEPMLPPTTCTALDGGDLLPGFKKPIAALFPASPATPAAAPERPAD